MFKEESWAIISPMEILHVEYREDEDENEMCYVYSVWTGRYVDCASKIKANIKIGIIGNEMTTVKGLLISSFENVPSSDEYARYFFWFPEAKVEDDEILIAIVSIEKCDKWKLELRAATIHRCR